MKTNYVIAAIISLYLVFSANKDAFYWGHTDLDQRAKDFKVCEDQARKFKPNIFYEHELYPSILKCMENMGWEKYK